MTHPRQDLADLDGRRPAWRLPGGAGAPPRRSAVLLLFGVLDDVPAARHSAAVPDDLDVLRVFLASRGNIRELEKHLGVSYPTARLRLTTVLDRLGLNGNDEPEPTPTLTREQVLAEVAAGALDPAEAQRLLVDL